MAGGGGPPDARSRARMAISDLFLDTPVDDDDFVRLRDQLRSTGSPLRELDDIYCDEVAPVLHRNLKSPAGVWSGFDAAWLDGEIQKRARSRGFAPLAPAPLHHHALHDRGLEASARHDRGGALMIRRAIF